MHCAPARPACPSGRSGATVRFQRACPTWPYSRRLRTERVRLRQRATGGEGTGGGVVNWCAVDIKSDRQQAQACDGHQPRSMSLLSDLEGAVVKFLGELAVFTTAAGAAPDFPDENCVHAGSNAQEAVRFVGLTPSVRRAFDLRIARTSPAVPKWCISFFSAGVSSSF